MEGIKEIRQAFIKGSEPQTAEAALKPQNTAAAYIPATEAAVQAAQTTPAERLADTLRAYGFKATEENIAMLRLMLETGIPLTKENVQRMNQAVKLTKSPDKAMFMLQNALRLTQANAAQLDGLVSGQTKITAQLSNLLASIEQLNDTALAAQLKQIVSGSGTQSGPPASTSLPAASPAGETSPVQTLPEPAAPSVPAAQESAQIRQNAQTTVPQPAAPQNTAQPPTARQSIVQQQITPQNTAQQPVQIAQGRQNPQAPQSVNPAQANQPTPQAQPAQINQPAQALQPAPVQTSDILPQAAPRPSATAQSAPSPAQAALPEGLLFRLAESAPQDIDRYLNTLRETISQLRQSILISGRETPETARILRDFAALETHIDFTAQIRNQLFVQLPMYHNDQQTLASLYVFKDAKKPSCGGAGASSALIALETVGMGHFETYVQKNARSVHCQFRLESDRIVQAVRDNIHKLDALLRDYDYTLDSFTFLPPGEPYTLLDSPEKFGGRIKNTEISLFDERA